jgi:hypothetical protein
MKAPMSETFGRVAETATIRMKDAERPALLGSFVPAPPPPPTVAFSLGIEATSKGINLWFRMILLSVSHSFAFGHHHFAHVYSYLALARS